MCLQNDTAGAGKAIREVTANVYDEYFYREQRDRSKLSARVVVPIIHELASPRSVLDVGCGVGTWAGVWLESGVADVLAVDGDYVNRAMLQIPENLFLSHDLTQPLELGRKFDVVTCFEVAEHLPAEVAPVLVGSLTRHSEIVVFSAAIPRQGGTGHVNEQWPSYWVQQFERLGFQVFDPIRARIWHSDQVDWWYRQNCLLFAREGNPIGCKLTPPTGPLDVVHPLLLKREIDRPVALTTTIAAKAQVVRHEVGKTPLGQWIKKKRDARLWGDNEAH